MGFRVTGAHLSTNVSLLVVKLSRHHLLEETHQAKPQPVACVKSLVLTMTLTPLEVSKFRFQTVSLSWPDLVWKIMGKDTHAN
jgi:hypothetical protein